MEKVRLNPKMITLAREARELTQADLATLVSIDKSNISKFEQDAFHFSDSVTKDIIKALNFPESFFHQNEEILPPAFYRKRDKVAAKLLNYIDANINIYRISLQRLFEALKYNEVKLPSLSLLEAGSPIEAAKSLRKSWKIKAGEIENLLGIIEEKGIITLAMDFKTDRVDSRSILIDGKFPVIFYNKNLLGDRLRFTLAYELGHLVMHAGKTLETREGLDHESNVFAAEFLMPKHDILPDFKDGINLEVLAKLKKKWKVSMQALLYRASDLGLLTDNQKRYIIGQFNSLKIRRREPLELDVPIEKSHLLRDLITKYRGKQKLSIKDTAAFFHLHEQEFLLRFT